MHLSENIATELKNWKTVVRACCAFVFCLVMVFTILSPAVVSAAQLETPKSNQQPNGEYLLDKVITWNDGNTEQVQIGKDGFFRLSGVKQKLVGMCLNLIYDGVGPGFFYKPENQAILKKELDYMESIGVRLIRIDLNYVRYGDISEINQEEKVYKSILDLIYQHKMLLVAEIIGKGMPGFNNLENPDFSWKLNIYGGPGTGTDSMLAWVARWAGIVGSYQNVVAVVADNELDYKYKASDISYIPNAQSENYTPEAVDRYMTLLTGILRQKINAPLTHNLMPNRTEPEIKRVCLSKIDIPSFDFYAETLSSLDTNLSDFLPWIGVSSGWWCMELNHMYVARSAIDVEGFKSSLIDSVFNHGAAVAILFWSNYYVNSNESFFDNDGNPKAQLVEVGCAISRLQAPISEMVTVAKTLKSNLDNNY
ncbi:MAG: hypothetical protein ABSA18_14430 [Dehalococcoidia bacterium]